MKFFMVSSFLLSALTSPALAEEVGPYGPNGYCFAPNIPNLYVWEQNGHYQPPAFLHAFLGDYRLSDTHWSPLDNYSKLDKVDRYESTPLDAAHYWMIEKTVDWDSSQTATNQDTHGVPILKYQEECTDFYRTLHKIGGFGSNYWSGYKGCCSPCGKLAENAECKSGLHCADDPNGEEVGVCVGEGWVRGFGRGVWHTFNVASMVMGVGDIVAGYRVWQAARTVAEAAEAFRVMDVVLETEAVTEVLQSERAGVLFEATFQEGANVVGFGSEEVGRVGVVKEVTTVEQAIAEAGELELRAAYSTVERTAGAAEKEGKAWTVAKLADVTEVPDSVFTEEYLEPLRAAQKGRLPGGAVLRFGDNEQYIIENLHKLRTEQTSIIADQAELKLYKDSPLPTLIGKQSIRDSRIASWEARIKVAKAALDAKKLEVLPMVSKLTYVMELSAEAGTAREVLSAPGGFQLLNGVLEIDGQCLLETCIIKEDEIFNTTMSGWKERGVITQDVWDLLAAHRKTVWEIPSEREIVFDYLETRMPNGNYLRVSNWKCQFQPLETVVGGIQNLEQKLWPLVQNAVKEAGAAAAAGSLAEGGGKGAVLAEGVEAFVKAGGGEKAEVVLANVAKDCGLDGVNAQRFARDARLLEHQRDLNLAVMRSKGVLGGAEAAEKLFALQIRTLAEEAVTLTEAVKDIEAGQLLQLSKGVSSSGVVDTWLVNGVPIERFLTRLSSEEWEVVKTALQKSSSELVRDLGELATPAEEAAAAAYEKASQNFMKGLDEARNIKFRGRRSEFLNSKFGELAKELKEARELVMSARSSRLAQVYATAAAEFSEQSVKAKFARTIAYLNTSLDAAARGYLELQRKAIVATANGIYEHLLPEFVQGGVDLVHNTLIDIVAVAKTSYRGSKGIFNVLKILDSTLGGVLDALKNLGVITEEGKRTTQICVRVIFSAWLLQQAWNALQYVIDTVKILDKMNPAQLIEYIFSDHGDEDHDHASSAADKKKILDAIQTLKDRLKKLEADKKELAHARGEESPPPTAGGDEEDGDLLSGLLN